MKPLILVAALGLSACVAGPAPVAPPGPAMPLAAPDPAPSPQAAARNFAQVVRRMAPEIAWACGAELGRENCDFQIVVDTTPGQPPNAFQTRDA